MSPIEKIIAEIKAIPDEQERNEQFRVISKALLFGLAISEEAMLLDAKPLVTFTKQNPATGEIYMIHPDSPRPEFEPAEAVLEVMREQVKAAKANYKPPTYN